MLRRSILVVLMLALTGAASAAIVYNQWSGSAGTSDWMTAGNWAKGYIPFIYNGVDQIKAGEKSPSTSVWPIITTGQVAEAFQFTLGGANIGGKPKRLSHNKWRNT